MNERNEQIKAVLSDAEFVQTLLDAENEEAVQKMLADKGVEMSLTEIELMGEMVAALADGTLSEEQLEKLGKAGELSEDDLAAVAGGGGPDPSEILRTASGDSVDTIRETVKTIVNQAGGSQAGYIIGGIAIGVAAIGAAGYGICKAVGYDIDSKLSAGYNWCKEKITSRW